MDCENCALYSYDEDYDDYVCSADIDEDDMYKMMTNQYKACPFFKDGDDYKIVKSQM